MITFRRGRERQLDLVQPEARPRGHATDAIATRFGSLEYLEGDRVAPGARVVRPSVDGVDILTYVREGNLAFDDGVGSVGTMSAGEFRRVSMGPDTHLVELNPSLTEDTHLCQIWLRPSPLLPGTRIEQRRFSVADRRGLACLVASPDGRHGSLRVRQDAFVYSGLLDRGQHVVHELQRGRSAWIHVVVGQVMFGDLTLVSGDGVGVTSQRAASLTALADSEILLVEVSAPYATRSQRTFAPAPP